MLTVKVNGELYNDLKRAMSKYIGETEENLATTFAESALLFFDEAEALFGKRSEVTILTWQ